MTKAEILTPWYEEVVDGEIQRQPLLTTLFEFSSWQDVTGQDSQNIVPQPNLNSIIFVSSQSVIDAIKQDARFYVLWEEDLL